jgi:hypothetical protein
MSLILSSLHRENQYLLTERRRRKEERIIAIYEIFGMAYLERGYVEYCLTEYIKHTYFKDYESHFLHPFIHTKLCFQNNHYTNQNDGGKTEFKLTLVYFYILSTNS